MKVVHSRCLSLLLLFALLLLCTATWQINAQFFTKTSKSIPRMGRRADNLIAQQDQLESKSLKMALEKSSASNIDSLKAFVSNLIDIRKFIHDNVLNYRRKLRKRS